MSMQTDILASKVAPASGSLQDQAGSNIARCRVRAVHVATTSASPGSVELRDGGATGVVIAVFTIAPTSSFYALLPAEGLLFRSGVYAVLTNVGSAVVFYS